MSAEAAPQGGPTRSPNPSVDHEELLDPVTVAALGYARKGWRVHPLYAVNADGSCMCFKHAQCPAPGKHPRLEGWQDKATTSGADILEWFGDRYAGRANIGIVTGPESGIWVLDIDPDHGGVESWTKLTTGHPKIDATRWHETGSEGQHLFFAWPDFEVPSTAGLFGRGIDTRGRGGYVVAPPSVSGKGSYTVVYEDDPVHAPGWMLEMLRGHAYRSAAASAEAEAEPVDLTAYPALRDRMDRDAGDDGDRSAWFHHLVAECRRAGLSQGQTITALEEWDQRVGKYPGRVAVEVARCWAKLSGEEPKQAAGGERDPALERGPLRECGPLSRPSLVVVQADRVDPKPIRWVWPGRIPAAKVTVLDGDPGQGKSTITTDIAARITTGSPWPGGRGPAASGDVVLISAEDGASDTIVPRLRAAGANLARVHILTEVQHGTADDGSPAVRPFDLGCDLKLLGDLVENTGAALVVIDPLMAFLGGRVDAHRDADIRRALHPVGLLADQTGAAVLIVRHLTKSGGGNAVYRGGGSIGIIGAARAGLVVAPHPDDESGERRVLAVSKSNLGPKPSALTYQLRAHDEIPSVAVIAWGDEVHISADEILRDRDEDDAPTPRLEAKEFLRDVLEFKPHTANEVFNLARKAGHAEKTIKRAKRELGVISKKEGFGKDSRWLWRLPPSKGATKPEGGHPTGLGPDHSDTAPFESDCSTCGWPIGSDGHQTNCAQEVA